MAESELFYRVLGVLERASIDERGLVEIPDEFRDDGCTWWFDSLFGYDIRHICRVHNYFYCSRTQPPGSMTPENKDKVDRELSDEISKVLPWWLDWTAGPVYRAVYMWGSMAYDTCKPDAGERCRHNMLWPRRERASLWQSRPVTLGQKQELFAACYARLILFALESGYKVRLGQVERTVEEQRRLIAAGLSGIHDPFKGSHVRKLAGDLHLFRDGLYLDKTEDHIPLGKYWESLHPLCRWGGHFADGNHYSIEHEGVRGPDGQGDACL